jgi:hypothetical protein
MGAGNGANIPAISGTLAPEAHGRPKRFSQPTVQKNRCSWLTAPAMRSVSFGVIREKASLRSGSIATNREPFP